MTVLPWYGMKVDILFEGQQWHKEKEYHQEHRDREILKALLLTAVIRTACQPVLIKL